MITILCLLMLDDRVTPEHFDKIKMGMTRQQVAFILGRPPVEMVKDTERLDFVFTSISHEIRQKGNLWKTGLIRIWVVFDKNGRVSGKMLEEGPFLFP